MEKLTAKLSESILDKFSMDFLRNQVLKNGRVVADGTRDQIFGDRALLEEVGIRPPEIFTMGQALDSRALCYTIDEFLSSFQEA